MARRKGTPVDRYIVKVNGEVKLVTISNGEAKRFAYQNNGEITVERLWIDWFGNDNIPGVSPLTGKVLAIKTITKK